MGEREPDLGPLRHGPSGGQEPIFSGPKGGTCVLSHFSQVRFFVTSWTVARQAALSMGFSRQEYWSRLPFPPPGDLPYPGIKPTSHVSCISWCVLYHQSHLGSPQEARQCMKVKSESEVTQSCPTLATPWTAAYQASPSMGSSRQKYQSGMPLPSPIGGTDYTKPKSLRFNNTITSPSTK